MRTSFLPIHSIYSDLESLSDSDGIVLFPQITKLWQTKYSNYSLNTLNSYLHGLRKQGLLHNIGRGKYTLSPHTTFQPTLSDSLHELNTLIQTNYPETTYCLWDTHIFSPLMEHIPVFHWTVLEVERFMLDPMLRFLLDEGKQAFINPSSSTMDYYVYRAENPIILLPLISQSPIQSIEGIPSPTIEKVLVDILSDTPSLSAFAQEKEFIWNEALTRLLVKRSTLIRYATRRKRENVAQTLLKELA